MSKPSILDRYQISEQQLTELIDSNGSLRGMLEGYIAEVKLRELWFSGDEFSGQVKHDDHDRSKKGDLSCIYKERPIRVESKSLQTATIEETADGFTAKAQVDASDRRKLRMPDGSVVETTCLLVGEFDLLAVSLFQYFGEWKYVFAKNSDLPRTTWRGYSEEQRKHLLATTVRINWPPKGIFRADPTALLDEICATSLVEPRVVIV